ncbi:MAG: hypothetical protein A3F73_08930 [Gallionellales bacterium RIFCSPLOWO2_12_FULL_59_22]|nr:MAG: hypothetical protein A3H99_03415 [Gallionellales bacterium RIFCSPLOWO2_02_FULL_59_110]OGT04182.1 MAG: hypothetical protein A2Z65_06565 [Gallionellales bacterium RIFCSPLOWO2_02_58_13]OGT12635.1 MAG: hypothetical protein A3F73_08930 [Gallionellales bacterium RIFCSPLOWO2_12_FULL_59_22]
MASTLFNQSGIVMANPVSIILGQSLAIFLLVGALSGIAASLLLIFKPHLMTRVNRAANRWISTRHLNQWLDRSVSIEQWIYRRHRSLGMLVVFGACYILVYFGLLFDKAVALQRLSGHMSAWLLDMLLDTLALASLTGAAAALFVGLFLWLRPSLLRGIEESANQWVSSRRAVRLLDIPHDQVERFVAGHAQRVGWLLLLGSIYLFVAVLRVWM